MNFIYEYEYSTNTFITKDEINEYGTNTFITKDEIKLTVVESIHMIIKETAKTFVLDNGRKVDKGDLNTLGVNKPYRRSYYDKPSFEEYKEAIIQDNQRHIDEHKRRIYSYSRESDILKSLEKGETNYEGCEGVNENGGVEVQVRREYVVSEL